MATKINYSVCVNNCLRFKVDELTGLYNATENPTGFDEPVTGPYASSVYDSKMYITDPNGTVHTVDMLDAGLPWPSSTEVTKTIENTQVGLGATTKLTNGIWKFQRIDKGVLNDAVTLWQDQKFIDYIIDCQLECCIAKLGVKSAQELNGMAIDCDNPNKYTIIWRKAWTALMSSRYLFSCNDYAGALNLQALVQRLCDENNCGC